MFIGPLGQVIFTTLKYPGIPFILGTHINLYTAPIMFTILISLVGALLLAFCFDGRMRVHKDISEMKNMCKFITKSQSNGFFSKR
jgi:hypothetical protein